MSIKNRLRFAAGAVAIATVAALTGCSAGSSGTTTVTVMWASSEFTSAYIKDFEKQNPNIKIKFIEFDQNRLNAMQTAGDPPDLVRGSPSANLFARHLATPLDDFIDKSKVIHASDLEPVNDLWRWNGKQVGKGELYGVVKDFSADTQIWQNTAVFQKAGVAPFSTSTPASWNDLLKTAEQLKAKGVQQPLGIEWQWGIASKVGLITQQLGGDVYNKSLTKMQLNSPEGIKAIQWAIDYGKAGVGPTSLNPLAEGQDAPSFMSGKMAATMDGAWFGGNLATEDGAAVGKTAELVPTPTDGDRIAASTGAVGGWIPEASKHKDAAWKVMEYFMAGKPAKDRAASGWGLPSLKSLWKLLPTKEPFQKQAVASAKQEVQYIVPAQDSPYAPAGAFNTTLDKELQKAIKGNATAEEVADAVDDQMNTLLAQGKDQLDG